MRFRTHPELQSHLRYEAAEMLGRVFTDAHVNELLLQCGKCARPTRPQTNRCRRCVLVSDGYRYRLPPSLQKLFGTRRLSWPHALVRRAPLCESAQLDDDSEIAEAYLRGGDFTDDPAAFQAAAAWCCVAAPRLTLDRAVSLLDELNQHVDAQLDQDGPDVTKPNVGGRFAEGISLRTLVIATAVRISLHPSLQGEPVYDHFLTNF